MSSSGFHGRAVFRPQRTDDLRPEAEAVVGQELALYWSGTVEDGPYDGDNIWIREPDDGPWVGWLPERDLEWTVEPDWELIGRMRDG